GSGRAGRGRRPSAPAQGTASERWSYSRGLAMSATRPAGGPMVAVMTAPRAGSAERAECVARRYDGSEQRDVNAAAVEGFDPTPPGCARYPLSPSTKGPQARAESISTGPSATLESRTGTTPGTPSATSRQSPPFPLL